MSMFYCITAPLWERSENLLRLRKFLAKLFCFLPLLAPAYVARGHIYSDLQQFDKAIADLDMSIGLDPTVAEAYCHRGWARFSKGLYKLAIADFDQAIAHKLIPPYLARTYCNRGRARAQLR